MDRGTAVRCLSALLAIIVLAGCVGATGGSPSASPVDLPAVTVALRNAGIAVVDVADNLNPRDGAWRCLPGSFRLARVTQQPPAAFARPGDRPSVDILIFATGSDRAAAQAAIGADGQTHAQGCGVMVDWVAAPHVVGSRNVLLFTASDDPAAVAALQAAATSLGP